MSSTAKQTGRFDWLKPPKGGPGGTMSLIDHLRELRYRLTIAVVAIIIAAIGAAFYYKELGEFIVAPYNAAKQKILEATDGTADIMLTNQGVVSPFTLAVIACVLAGLVISSPIWLYQIWAYLAPALLKHEKKYVLVFIGGATPLFLAGCALGYIVWARGIEIMLSFTLRDLDVVNMLDMTDFLQKEILIMLVFGVSFVLPVLLVMLNLAGVVHGFQLGKARKFVILGSTIFAAVATPTMDPFSMLAMVIPMSLLFFLAEGVCRLIDKSRGITEATYAEFNPELDDDE